MPATPGEQQLLAVLNKLAAGQAPGSFGPGQALAMLAGFIKLRDRVDELANTGGRCDAIEELVDGLQNVVASHSDLIQALEEWKVGIEGRLGDLEQRVATLESPPPP